MVMLIRVFGIGHSALASLFRELQGMLFIRVKNALLGWHVLHVSGNTNNSANAGTFTFNGNNLLPNLKRNIISFNYHEGDIMAGRKPTHGMSKTRPYHIWRMMKTRCDNPNPRLARFYNGISYDPKWKTFEGFWQDMQAGYDESLTLDRIDSKKNYCKDNCRWATMKEQSRNRKDNVLIPYNGETLCASDFADKVGLPRSLIYTRVARGEPLHMLSRPSRKKRKSA